MSRRLNPEIRAAEIVAAIRTDYRHGGWFACMTPGEQAGWDLHESEYWVATSERAKRVPRNAREWAGWLAREIHYGFEVPASVEIVELRERGWKEAA